MADRPVPEPHDRADDDREQRIAAAEAMIAMNVRVDVDETEADAARFDA
jgi:hypothetical protein